MRTKLEEWLEIIPSGDHDLAKSLWRNGAFRFAKYPITLGRDLSDPKVWQAAGPVRPLQCPEPPPEGCCFRLTWDSGDGWVLASLLDLLKFFGDPLLETARKLHAAALAEIAGDGGEGKPSNAGETTRVLQALEEAAQLGAPADAVALAFLAGCMFTSSGVIKRCRPAIRRGTLLRAGKTSGDPEWSEIISAAVQRHENITKLQLLKLFSMQKNKSKIPLAVFYPPDPKVELMPVPEVELPPEPEVELPPEPEVELPPGPEAGFFPDDYLAYVPRTDSDLPAGDPNFNHHRMLPEIEWARFTKIFDMAKSQSSKAGGNPLPFG